MARLNSNYQCRVPHFWRRRLPDACRLARRRDLAHLLRQGQSNRAGPDDNFQRAVRHYIIFIPLLRRDDNLPRNDLAYGGLCLDLMASQSIRRLARRGKGEFHKSARGRTHLPCHRRDNGDILLYFEVFQYRKPAPQHRFGKGSGNIFFRIRNSLLLHIVKNIDYMSAQGEVLRSLRTKAAYNKL